MGRVIAVSMIKGGVGKTTIAVNLAAALAALGRQVLLVDADTQGQAGAALGVRPTGSGLADVLLNGTAISQAADEARPGLFLLAGGPDLAAAERDITRADFGGERRLARALDPVVGRFDYVLIDTGPGWAPLMLNSLFAAGELLTPVTLEGLAVRALADFVQRLQPVQEYAAIRLAYVVPVGYDRRLKQSGEILAQLGAAFGELVTDPIRINVRLSEAATHGQSIFEFAPGSAGAADFADLAQRILNDER